MRFRTTNATRSIIDCILLATIVLQMVPLALQQPELIESTSEEAIFRYFEPLPICDDHEDPIGFLADYPCLPGPVLPLPFLPRKTVSSLTVTSYVPNGFTPLVFRPPRIPPS